MAAASPWAALGIALAVQTAVSCAEQGIPTLTVFVKSDLAVSAAAAGLLVSSFNIGKIFGAYAGGRAADRLGERRVLFAGALLAGLLVVCAAPAPLALLAVLLCAAGLVSASSTPAGGKLVLLAFPYRRRGLAMGIRQAGIPVGGLVAALVLPALAHAWGWRTALAGAGAITLAITLAVLAVSRRGVAGDPAPEPAGGAEERERPRLSRDPDIRLLSLWGSILVGGQYVTITFLALDLHAGSGVRLRTAATLIAVAQVGGIAGRILWGLASDRVFAGRRKPPLLLITGLGLVTALTLALLPRPAPLAVFALAALLAGLSLIGWQGLWVTAMGELAGPARVGAVTGFGLTFVAVAIAASPPLYGLVIDLAGGFRTMWAVLAATLVAALAVASRITEPAPEAALRR